MPLPRRKSCEACRVAKARCSRTSPCSRCQMRHLSCDYGDPFARLRTNRHKAQALAPALTHNDETSTLFDVGNIHSGLGTTVDTEYAQTGVTSGSSDGNGLDTDTEASENIFEWLSWSDIDDLGQINDQSYQPSIQAIEKKTFSLPFLSNIGSGPPARLPYTASHARHSISLSSRNYSARDMSLSSLTSKVLGSQLLSYPGMMLGNYLPPFIFPSCVPGEPCTGARGHQCLPTALANCRAVVSMFETMTPSNHEFICKTVYREAERLQREVCRALRRVISQT